MLGRNMNNVALHSPFLNGVFFCTGSTAVTIIHSPKVNVCCSPMHNKVTGPFFSTEPRISALCWTSVSAMDHFPTWCAPPHWNLVVYQLLNANFQTDELGWMVKHYTHHIHRTILFLTFLLLGIHYKVFSSPVLNIETLKARTT